MDYLNLSVDCDTIRVSIPLSIPLPSTGKLSFSSNPPGADIYLIIGDLPTYTERYTPNTIDLYPGIYDYTLKLIGFEDYYGTTVVYSNETTFINVNLTPKIMKTIEPVLAATGSLFILGFLLATSAKQTIQ